MNEKKLDEIAQDLCTALDTKVPIAPLREHSPEMTPDDAYQIQIRNVRHFLSEGARLSGRKVGLVIDPIRRMYNATHPISGYLLDSMEQKDGIVHMDLTIQPHVLGEIAFKLKKKLHGPSVTAEQVLDATEYVTAAMECCDCRIQECNMNMVELIADNACVGYYVLGSKKVDPYRISLPKERMLLFKNGVEVADATGYEALGSPAECVSWLANKLDSYGIVLKQGDMILAGSLCIPEPAQRGDEFLAEFSELGNVGLRFQ